MSDLCKRSEFDDGQAVDLSISDNNALVMARGPKGECLTNVPHLVVHHSPCGFEFGYAGSGPADLALNVCQFYLNSIGYQGEKAECFDGRCWSLAWVLHQNFKSAFIATASQSQGATIPLSEIAEWFEEHITDQMKEMYSAAEAA